MLGLVADCGPFANYKSTQWRGPWGVQHLRLFNCFDHLSVLEWTEAVQSFAPSPVSWWDHNVSITFVVACGLPRLALCYGLFSHHCIPQARGMCSLCPKSGTRCSSLSVKTPVLEMVWLPVKDWERCCGVWEHVWNAVKENKWSPLWRRETDRDTNFTRGDKPEFDLSNELGTHRRDDYKLTAKSSSTADMIEDVSSKKEILSFSFKQAEWPHWPQWTQQISMEAFGSTL